MDNPWDLANKEDERLYAELYGDQPDFRINPTVLDSITKGVKELVGLIQEEGLDDPDVTPNPPINSIYIKRGSQCQWIVYASLGESDYRYKYAIYIDSEGRAETDGY